MNIRSLSREDFEAARRFYRIERRHILDCMKAEPNNFMVYRRMISDLYKRTPFQVFAPSCDSYSLELCHGWVIERAMNKQGKTGQEASALAEKLGVYSALTPYLQNAA